MHKIFQADYRGPYYISMEVSSQGVATPWSSIPVCAAETKSFVKICARDQRVKRTEGIKRFLRMHPYIFSIIL